MSEAKIPQLPEEVSEIHTVNDKEPELEITAAEAEEQDSTEEVEERLETGILVTSMPVKDYIDSQAVCASDSIFTKTTVIFCSSKRAELEDILKIIRKLKSSNDVKTKDGEVLSELKMIEEEHDGAKQRQVL